jgi:hypothetical protein
MAGEKEILRLIDGAAETGATTLDLSWKHLAALPAEITQLTNLTTLNLRSNRLMALPVEIAQLANLTKLDLSYNRVAALPAEIGRLTNLEYLDVSRNRLAALPAEIGRLAHLRRLDLSDNQLATLPAEITRLTNLTWLSLWGNQLTTLPAEITRLTNLTKLYLGGNGLTALPPEIGRLTNLTELYLWDNKLTALPAEIGRLTNLTTLDLRENPLEVPPPEVARRGIEAICNYFRRGEPARAQPTRALWVFLCHSSHDKPAVRDLCRRLSADGMDPWLDEEKILAGQDWELEVRKAVRAADTVIVCLSRDSVGKRGFVQKEIRLALDVADEQPEGAIFVIPLKLEECDVPERLLRWQWVNYFAEDGYERLMVALRRRAQDLDAEASPGSLGQQYIQSDKSVKMLDVQDSIDDARYAKPAPGKKERDDDEETRRAGNVTIEHADKVIIGSGSGDERMAKKRVQEPTVVKSAWANGSFYLFVFVVVIGALGVLANTVPVYVLPLLMVAGILFVPLIGFLQLRMDERLREKSFIELVTMVAAQLPLIGKLGKQDRIQR